MQLGEKAEESAEQRGQEVKSFMTETKKLSQLWAKFNPTLDVHDK